MFSKTKLEKINPKGLFLHSFPVNAKCKKKGPERALKEMFHTHNIISPSLFYICKENYFMKMNLLEYLDRTGRHVSRKTFEKYKGKKKSFVGWEILFNIYETCR